MNYTKGTPAYWKSFYLIFLAMVKQLGESTFFMTLSSADMRWNELISIINKPKQKGLSAENIEHLSVAK